MTSEEIAATDATLRDNAELRAALDVALAENEQWRAQAARLQLMHHDAWKLIGRCDFFLETYAAQPAGAARKLAAQLRGEIKKASGQ